ncbi:hypothetical protein LshimejAT787_3200150 [Lyophyllum shimeji]|uniref:Uncharacterized protein n=1 Tax=Lyophyllum shimeji TaxID=47721 RepID=A0A9P3Q277_LYOSH|nr:hypothetical protein LshimejAT787_3200150 [Lyophyllum shimeji]
MQNPCSGDPWLSAYRKDERRTTQTCATCSTSRTHAKNPPHIRFITIAESLSFTWATPDDPKGRTADEVTAEENAIRTPSATRSTRVPCKEPAQYPIDNDTSSLASHSATTALSNAEVFKHSYLLITTPQPPPRTGSRHMSY